MAGTITGTLTRIAVPDGRPKMAKLVLSCVGDSSTGSFPATIINGLQPAYPIEGLQLYSVKTIPGAQAPADASDITITDEYGVDLLGGKGTNLVSATAPKWALFGPVNYTASALITGDLTINISNNSVAGARITIVIELLGA